MRKECNFQMYSIGICDDGQNFCGEIENMIVKYLDRNQITADIQVWYTGEGICNYLKEKNSLDILFLDLELFHLSGIEVGHFIRNVLEDRKMQIIFVSNWGSYAQQLFKVQPMDFLIKPLTQNQVDEALTLAFRILENDAQKFRFQQGKNYYSVPFGEIVYFASEGRKIRIITLHGEYTFYGKLKETGKLLPRNFLSIHQSYIINKTFVSRYSYDEVELSIGTVLSISKAYRKHIRICLLEEA